VVASILATRGDLDGAWRTLEPRLDDPHLSAQLLDLAAQLAHDRGDDAAAARVQARFDLMIDTLQRRELIRSECWESGVVSEFDRQFANIPLDAVVLKQRIDLCLHVSRQAEALLTFGRLLAVSLEPTDTPPLLGIAHSHGFNPLQRASTVTGDLEAHLARAPLDPAGYLASCRYQVKPDNPEYEDRLELSDRAADAALEAAALAPRRAGPLLLAAFCTMDAGDLAEAAALIAQGEHALGGRSDLVWFLTARLAALRGDPRAAESALHAMQKDPQNNKSIYRVKEDPAFKPHLAAGRLKLPPDWN
jgi:hypothetical protein